jgi:hypothetical protein
VQTFYKIRRKKDGMFVEWHDHFADLYGNRGGSTRWSKKGKVWQTEMAVLQHVGPVLPKDYKDCEIVTYTITEGSAEPASEWAQREKERQRKKRADELRRSNARRRKDSTAFPPLGTAGHS